MIGQRDAEGFPKPGDKLLQHLTRLEPRFVGPLLNANAMLCNNLIQELGLKHSENLVSCLFGIGKAPKDS